MMHRFNKASEDPLGLNAGFAEPDPALEDWKPPAENVPVAGKIRDPRFKRTRKEMDELAARKRERHLRYLRGEGSDGSSPAPSPEKSQDRPMLDDKHGWPLPQWRPTGPPGESALPARAYIPPHLRGKMPVHDQQAEAQRAEAQQPLQDHQVRHQKPDSAASEVGASEPPVRHPSSGTLIDIEDDAALAKKLELEECNAENAELGKSILAQTLSQYKDHKSILAQTLSQYKDQKQQKQQKREGESSASAMKKTTRIPDVSEAYSRVCQIREIMWKQEDLKDYCMPEDALLNMDTDTLRAFHTQICRAHAQWFNKRYGLAESIHMMQDDMKIPERLCYTMDESLAMDLYELKLKYEKISCAYRLYLQANGGGRELEEFKAAEREKFGVAASPASQDVAPLSGQDLWASDNDVDAEDSDNYFFDSDSEDGDDDDAADAGLVI